MEGEEEEEEQQVQEQPSPPSPPLQQLQAQQLFYEHQQERMQRGRIKTKRGGGGRSSYNSNQMSIATGVGGEQEDGPRLQTSRPPIVQGLTPHVEQITYIQQESYLPGHPEEKGVEALQQGQEVMDLGKEQRLQGEGEAELYLNHIDDDNDDEARRDSQVLSDDAPLSTKNRHYYSHSVTQITLRKNPSLYGSTNPFGFHIIGGKEIPSSGGCLGAYISKISPEFLENQQQQIQRQSKIQQGDVVLEINGFSLENKTFEEVQSILEPMEASSDSLTLILRNNFDITTGKARLGCLTNDSSNESNPPNLSDLDRDDDAELEQYNTNVIEGGSSSNIAPGGGNRRRRRGSARRKSSTTSSTQQSTKSQQAGQSVGGGGRSGSVAVDAHGLLLPISGMHSALSSPRHSLNESQLRRSPSSSTVTTNEDTSQAQHQQQQFLRIGPPTKSSSPAMIINSPRRSNGGGGSFRNKAKAKKKQQQQMAPQSPLPFNNNPINSNNNDNNQSNNNNNTNSGGGGLFARAMRRRVQRKRSIRYDGQIQLQICHDPKAAILYVTVLKAKLPSNVLGTPPPHAHEQHLLGHHHHAGGAPSSGSTLDPYILVSLVPPKNITTQRRTRHIPNTNNPVWNQTMVYPNINGPELANKTLEISAWHFVSPTNISTGGASSGGAAPAASASSTQSFDVLDGNDICLGLVNLALSEEGVIDERPHLYHLTKPNNVNTTSTTAAANPPSSPRLALKQDGQERTN